MPITCTGYFERWESVIAGGVTGSVSFSVTMDSQLVLGKEVVDSKYIVMKGQCPSDGNRAQVEGRVQSREWDL